MKKTILRIFIFLTIGISAFGQDCPKDTIIASLDSNYFNKITSLLVQNISNKCPIGSPPNWSVECNEPRKILFIFIISVDCDSVISDVRTRLAEFSYKDQNGKLIKEAINEDGYLAKIKNCFIKEIFGLSKIEPIQLEGQKQNVTIPYAISIIL